MRRRVPVLIVGDGLLLHYHDRELGQVNDWAIFDTPLGRAHERGGPLRRRSGGDSDRAPRGAYRDHRGCKAATRDPGVGSLTLIFETEPLVLRQWRVTDAQGLVTTVSLLGLETNVALRPALFVFDDPREKTHTR